MGSNSNSNETDSNEAGERSMGSNSNSISNETDSTEAGVRSIRSLDSNSNSNETDSNEAGERSMDSKSNSNSNETDGNEAGGRSMGGSSEHGRRACIIAPAGTTNCSGVTGANCSDSANLAVSFN
jgi:hypothetical protein